MLSQRRNHARVTEFRLALINKRTTEQIYSKVHTSFKVKETRRASVQNKDLLLEGKGRCSTGNKD